MKKEQIHRLKIDDTSGIQGTVLEDYWDERGFDEFFKLFRQGSALPQSMHVLPNSQQPIIDKYHLRGFQYGRWVNDEDRWNYLAACFISLKDLNSVLRFPDDNVGLDGLLTIAFGARGRSQATAHYESWEYAINLTRYWRSDKFTNNPFWNGPAPDKKSRFVGTGGPGALAHEYGHFLDYVFGEKIAASTKGVALSGARTLRMDRLNTSNAHPLRVAMDDVLEQIIWQDPEEKVKSSYYTRLEETLSKDSQDYWFRRNELFARIWEQFIQVKLKQKGIKNLFLNTTKYNEKVYMTRTELNKVIPKIDHLLELMRGEFK